MVVIFKSVEDSSSILMNSSWHMVGSELYEWCYLMEAGTPHEDGGRDSPLLGKFCSVLFTLDPEYISTTCSLSALWQKFYFPCLWAIPVFKSTLSVLKYGCPSHASWRFIGLFSRAEGRTGAPWAAPPHTGSKKTAYGGAVKMMLRRPLRGAKEL